MYIYIVLSYTGSLPAKVIKATTRNKYAHSSVSSDPNLLTMFSFGRKYLYFPWYGGFINEGLDKGLFSRLKESQIAVYRMKVTQDEMKLFEKKIKTFEKNSKYYIYDYIGLLGILIDRKLFRKNGYVCSNFVAEVLDDMGVDTNKESWKVRPEDLVHIDNLDLIYEGLASEYSNDMIHKQQKK